MKTEINYPDHIVALQSFGNINKGDIFKLEFTGSRNGNTEYHRIFPTGEEIFFNKEFYLLAGENAFSENIDMTYFEEVFSSYYRIPVEKVFTYYLVYSKCNPIYYNDTALLKLHIDHKRWYIDFIIPLVIRINEIRHK